MPWSSGRVADTILRQMEAHRKRLGAQLLELRKGRGWNQDDAAHEVGVGVKTWRLWERGKTMPYDSNIRKIADVFGIDPDELGQDRPAPLGIVAYADTPELLEQLKSENALAEVLAQLHAAVTKQNELLERQTKILDRIEAAIKVEDETATRLAAAEDEWVQRTLQKALTALSEHEDDLETRVRGQRKSAKSASR